MPVHALLAALGRGATVVKPTLNVTISTNALVGDLSTWFTNNVGGYLGASGYSVINLTINSGIDIGSPSSGSTGLQINGFGADCTLNITNGGTIYGGGGNGGDASAQSYANQGSDGGTGLFVSAGQGPINFTNNGTINGGSGGGGAAWGSYSYCTSADPKYGSCGAYATAYTAAGGGGGRGYNAGNGGGATGGSGNQGGSAGSKTSGGSGGSQTNATGGAGGSTIAYGGAAGSQTGGNNGQGGAAGYAVQGSSYITWLATGTRNGSIGG